ncbi:uncharacterized protein (TIGR02099 family) [Natronospira proteinivora]|uniref:Uncharacterized protein (TIGR02099 family) n=1 Tax=Natronospira proteinivora TaxID=1807133 RepID=A0ABT1G8N8_9GAMM|nr:YhdP family protein [Natronospira proteinivora]MCP1727691.1 uncharacterized protein (TIGR02099 family) [Natronospira proteinivora]
MTAGRWGRRIRLGLLGLLATTLILMAVVVGTFRLLVPQVPEYREWIADWAGEAIGAPMEIAEMDVRWRWLVPKVVLSDVSLYDESGAFEPIRADEITVRISLLDLLRPGPLRPGRVVLSGGTFEIARVGEDEFHLPGIGIVGGGDAELSWEEGLVEILAHADYRIEDSLLRFHDRSDAGEFRIGDWQLALEHLSLQSSDQQHQLSLVLDMESGPRGRLELDFQGQGPADQPGDWQWQSQLKVDAREIQLGQHGFSPEWLAPLLLGLEGRLRVSGRGFTPGQAEGDIRIPSLAPGGEGPMLTEDRAGDALELGGINWHRDGRGWQLSLAELDLGGLGGNWPASRLEMRWRGDHEQARLTGNLRYANIADLNRLANRLLHGDFEGRDWLSRFSPHGEVRDLLGELTLKEGRPEDYSLRGRVVGLGMESWEKIPGFSGVSGWFSGDQDQGFLEIDAGPVHLDYPDLFRERITATRLQSRVEWQRDGDVWWVRADEIMARNPDARAEGDLMLEIEPGEPTWIQLNAQVPEARSDNLSDYLPVGRMPERAVEWLDTAIVSGRAFNGEVKVDGPSRPFPYENGEGVFQIGFDVRDGELDYEAGWPRLREADARVEFDGAGMEIRSRRGEIAGYEVVSGRASIDDLREPVLLLQGQARGRVADGVDFLRDSPLGEWFGQPLAPLDLDGDATVAMTLNAPIRDFGALQLDGQATLSDVNGTVDWLPGEIRGLSGELQFTEDGAAGEGIRGQHLGHDFRVDIDPGSRGRDADSEAAAYTRAHIGGGASVEALREALPENPWLDRLSGDFDWVGQVDVPNEPDSGPVTVHLESDLVGTGIDLPAPVGKSADDSAPLRVHFPVTERVGPVWADYRGLMALSLAISPETASLSGLNIHFNEPRRPDVPQPGIYISGYLAELDATPWLGLDWPQDGGDQGMKLERLSLGVERLLLGPLDLGDQRLNLERAEADWVAQLDGPRARGSLRIPMALDARAAPVVGALSRLDLAWRPARGLEVDELLPSRVPAIRLNVDDLRHGLVPLGALDLRLDSLPRGLSLSQFELTGTHMNADLSGEWREDSVAGTVGTLVGHLESTDVAETLAALGYAPGIEGNRGRLEVDLSWQGPPGWSALPSLMGEARLEMGSGQLREVSPGAGRVFGLLSLTALPRRLFGDFRDVFGQGLRYDSIEGDFFLVDGDAFTPNLVLTGPAATVTLRGRTGLASRDYDQRMTIETPVGATLPVAGAIAGGATMGAAMLLLSEIFREPLSRMGSLEYRIDGDWESPRLIPLDEAAREALEE